MRISDWSSDVCSSDLDGHADGAAAVGVAARWRESPRRDRPAVPAVAVAGGGAGRGAVRAPEPGGTRAGADGHRAGDPPRRRRIPARHPLGRAGADAVLLHALPQRRPALDPADDGALLRWASVAGYPVLGADVRPVRPALARTRR